MNESFALNLSTKDMRTLNRWGLLSLALAEIYDTITGRPQEKKMTPTAREIYHSKLDLLECEIIGLLKKLETNLDTSRKILLGETHKGQIITLQFDCPKTVLETQIIIAEISSKLRTRRSVVCSHSTYLVRNHLILDEISDEFHDLLDEGYTRYKIAKTLNQNIRDYPTGYPICSKAGKNKKPLSISALSRHIRKL